jgi:hypothetical protein
MTTPIPATVNVFATQPSGQECHGEQAPATEHRVRRPAMISEVRVAQARTFVGSLGAPRCE